MLALALPVVGSSLLERLVQIVDIFLVGGLGADAIASVGLTQLLVFSALNLLAGLTMGVTILVAQLWGAKRRDEAARIAAHSLLLGGLAAVALGALGAAAGPAIARLLGATPSMLGMMHGYVLIIFVLFPSTFIVDQLVAIMQGAGDTRTPLAAVIIVNVLHVAIAYPLIYGHWGLPALGIDGAALAIGLSETAGVVFLLVKARTKGYVNFERMGHWPGGLFEQESLVSVRQIFRVGYPITLDRLLQQLSQLAYAKIVLGYGAVVYAAHQVGLSLEALSFMSGNGFAIAAATAVGQSIGAKNLARAKIENWEANRLAVLVMTGMGLLFFFFPYLLLRAFAADAAVVDYATLFLKIVALLQIPLAITMVLGGSLKGAGDTHFLMLVTLLGAWLVRVPVASGLAWMGMSIGWIWMVMVLDWSVRMGCVLWRYRSEQWQPE